MMDSKEMAKLLKAWPGEWENRGDRAHLRGFNLFASKTLLGYRIWLHPASACSGVGRSWREARRSFWATAMLWVNSTRLSLEELEDLNRAHGLKLPAKLAPPVKFEPGQRVRVMFSVSGSRFGRVLRVRQGVVVVMLDRGTIVKAEITPYPQIAARDGVIVDFGHV